MYTIHELATTHICHQSEMTSVKTSSVVSWDMNWLSTIVTVDIGVDHKEIGC